MRQKPNNCVELCASRLSDAQHMLTANRFLVVGLPKVLHGEDGSHNRSNDTGIDQTRDFDQLSPVWFDDEEGVAHSLLGQPFGIRRYGHQPTTLAEDLP